MPAKKTLIDEYHDCLRDAKRYFEQVQKTNLKKGQLLEAKISETQLSRAIDDVKDQYKDAKFLHKEALDKFIEVCEQRLRQSRDDQVLRRIHGDLVSAGFNFEKHGVDHPILQKLNFYVKRGEAFLVPNVKRAKSGRR